MTPRRFVRTRKGRLVGGVCSGLGSYFNVDPILFRIAFVGVSLFGGFGLGAYLLLILFVPEEGADRAPWRTLKPRGRSWLGILGFVVLLVGVWLLLHAAAHWTLGEAGGVVGGIGALLLVAGASGWLWWHLRPGSADPRSADRKLFRVLAWITLVGSASIALGIGSGWAAGMSGEVGAWLVVAAGVALVGAAFAGKARWLALPAVAIALPVSVVTAADVDLRGGVGDRTYRPQSLAELGDSYELGAGQLEVDLRDLDLPPGDTPLDLRVGIGEIVLLVRDDVCVATRADVGAGYVGALDRDAGGMDVDWSEEPDPPAGVSRLVVDGEVGLGALFVANRDFHDDWGKGNGFQLGEDGSNAACRGEER